MRWLLLIALAGCKGGTPPASDMTAVSFDAGTNPVPVYERCQSHCVRPSDCEIAYTSGEYCPAGFRCAYNFTCVADGGS